MMSARLRWGAFGTQWILVLLLCCLLPRGAQGQMFPLSLKAPRAVLDSGGPVLVTCSTECPNASNLVLETPLPKELNSSSLGWATFWLSNLTEDTRIICSVLCGGSQVTASSNITVYRFPEEVELGPLPPWQPVGQNLTLRCLVVGGAPRARLTVVLLRGAEELNRLPVTRSPKEVTATVPVGRDDHGANFSCRTELDLRPEGLGLFLNTSDARRLRTFTLPVTAPHLEAPRSLEVGTQRLVHCSLDGLFPVFEAQVHLMLGNQTLNPTVTRDGNKLRANATVRVDQDGTKQIVCNITLGGVSRSTQIITTAFSFPRPILHLSKTRVCKGSTVNVTCTARPGAQVILDGVLAPSLGEPAQLQLIATDSDNGRQFICNATLTVAGELMYRSTAIQLHVVGRNSSVTIGLTVIAVLGVIVIAGALLYIFRMQKRCDIYHLTPQNNSVPLTATQSEDTMEEDAS